MVNGIDCSETHLFLSLQALFVIYDIPKIQKRKLDSIVHLVNVEQTAYSMNLYRCAYYEDLGHIILGDYYKKNYTVIDVNDLKKPVKVEDFVRTGDNDHLLHVSYVKSHDMYIAYGNH